jgi:hypothetical protein
VRHIDVGRTTKDGRYAPWDAIEFLKPILGTKKTIIISSNHAKREHSLSPLSREKSRNRFLARTNARCSRRWVRRRSSEKVSFVSLSLSLPYKIRHQHTGESTRRERKKKRKTEIRKITPRNETKPSVSSHARTLKRETNPYRLCERKHFIRFCGLKLKRVCVFMAFAIFVSRP